MADGLIFYWFSWILWIIITFIMNKGCRRTKFACWLLIGLLCSNTYFSFEDYNISLSFLFLFSGGILLQAKLPGLQYTVFLSLTVMIGYTAVLLWEFLAPVWIILPRFILIPLLLFITLCFLADNIYHRLTAGLTGVCGGEIIYNIIMSSYHFRAEIGDSAFFDQLITLIVLIVCWNFLGNAKRKLFRRSPRSHPNDKPGEPLPKTALKG